MRQTSRCWQILAFAGLFFLCLSNGLAAEDQPMQAGSYSMVNPFSFILLELGLVVIIALIAQVVSNHFRFPIVIGELLIGVIVGNLLYWLGWSPFFYLLMHLGDAGELFKSVWNSDLSVAQTAERLFDAANVSEDHPIAELVRSISGQAGPEFVVMVIALWIFSNFGVFLVLFKLGLETKLQDLIKAERTSFAISAVGAGVPFLLGLLVSWVLLSEYSSPVHIFVAASLCTTSAAITAQLFSELKAHDSESRVVLDAAYIDDVIGIFVLAILMGTALHERAGILDTLTLFTVGVLFFGAVIWLGKHCSRYMTEIPILTMANSKLIFPVAVIFIMSWIAEMLELGIVAGAFAAGLVLAENEHNKLNAEALIKPLETIIVPIFYVFVGMQVNLKTILEPKYLFLALLLSLAAIFGKLATSYVVRGSMNRLLIGLGMVPRGEAVLIFISVGKILGVIPDSIFSVLVIMVILTNFVAPWGLKRLAKVPVGMSRS